jgi:hypothetical protein
MSADPIEWNPVLIKQLDHRWPTDAKQIGGLLRRQRLGLRRHSHRKSLPQGLDDLPQGSIELSWQLDLVAWSGACQEVSGGDRTATGSLVSLQEVVDLSNLLAGLR